MPTNNPEDSKVILPPTWGKIRVRVADGYHYRSLEDMEDAVWALRVENIRDVLGMSSGAFSKVITDYVFDSLEREEAGMTTGAFNNGIEEKVFKVGDRVKHTQERGVKGTIQSLYAHVKCDSDVPHHEIYTSIALNNLTHYDGPTSEEDAWERVTMDIAAVVSGWHRDHWSSMSETYLKQIRHDAYVVLGSVRKIDEEVKQRVRDIIVRAEKRFIDHH